MNFLEYRNGDIRLYPITERIIYIMRYAVTAYEAPAMDDKEYQNWKTYDTKPEKVDPEFEAILELEE